MAGNLLISLVSLHSTCKDSKTAGAPTVTGVQAPRQFDPADLDIKLETPAPNRYSVPMFETPY